MTSGPRRIEIVWSEEDDAYIATTPEIEGCSALGVSPMRALEEMLVAAALWADADPDSGDAVGREATGGPLGQLGQHRVAPGP